MVKNIILIFILLLALILRIFRVDTNPPALYWDEVAMGYNAYSIIKTGADEYGHKLPFFFESFQDYKLPGYIYSLIPGILLFGVSPLTIRLPSILFGFISIIGIYVLGKNILGTRVGLLSAFIVSIIPWHIQLTRVGFEVSGGFALLIFGLLFLCLGRQKKLHLYIGVFLLILSLSFYNGLRIIVPVVLISYLLFFSRSLQLSIKDLLWGTITLILLSPVIYQFMNPDALVRFRYTSIFSDPTLLEESINKKESVNNFLGKVWYHRYRVYGEKIARNYFAHFSPDFLLFDSGENVRHKVSGIGLLYLWTVPFLIFGLYTLIHQRNESLKLILPLLLAAPIASSFTIPSPHALRSFPLLIPLIFIIAFGITSLVKHLKGGRNAYLPAGRDSFQVMESAFIILILVFAATSLSRYLFEFYFFYPKHTSRDWAYGYKEVFEKAKKFEARADTIFISGRYWRPYIFALYYLDIDPKTYQKNPTHSQIGKFIFGHADYDVSDPFYDYKTYDNNIVHKLRQKGGNNYLFLSPQETKAGDIVIDNIQDLKRETLFNITKSRSK